MKWNKTRSNCYPLSFPIGMIFQGIYNLWEQNINLFSGDNQEYRRNHCFFGRKTRTRNNN
jgi:peptide subunit release factor RF-3